MHYFSKFLILKVWVHIMHKNYIFSDHIYHQI